MLRLMSAKNAYYSGLLKRPVAISPSTPQIECSFCRKVLLGATNIENLLLFRHQTTKTANVLHKSSKKKYKYKNPKKYGEVLEVGNKEMTETKVSISRLKAAHLSNLAESSWALDDLHQLTTKKKIHTEIDPELLKEVKEKILNGSSSYNKKTNTDIDPELLKKVKDQILNKSSEFDDDKCTLIFTSKTLNLEDRLKTKEYFEAAKNSYNNFRKLTLYDKHLHDLDSAINVGLNQELDMYCDIMNEPLDSVLKEIIFDNRLMDNISADANQGIANPALDEVYDDADPDMDIDTLDPAKVQAQNNTLKVKKITELRKAKKRAKKLRIQAQEAHMKEELKDLVAKGKKEALQTMLVAHLQLLCALNMTHESQQVLNYYKNRNQRRPQEPKIDNVKVYNTLLHGYASMKQHSKALELYNQMLEDGIKVDHQTFTALFEATERSDLQDKVTHLNSFVMKMNEMNITLNDLLDKSILKYDQREIVLQAIRRITPGFTPIYTPPPLDYICPLLENLKIDKPENRQGLKECPMQDLLTVEELKQRMRKQLDIELKGYIEVDNISVCDEPTDAMKICRNKLQDTETEWRKVVKESLLRNLSSLHAQSNVSFAPISIYPYFKMLPVDDFVDLIIGEIMKLIDGSETYSPSLRVLQMDLGSQVFQKYQIEQYRSNGMLNKLERILDDYCEWYVNRKSIDGSDTIYNSRQAWQMLVHKHSYGPTLDVQEPQWSMEIRHNIGKFLYNIIINDVKINVNILKNTNKVKLMPAVYKVHRPWNQYVRCELKPHPCLSGLWVGARKQRLKTRAALAPLSAPARPWTHVYAKPYLLTYAPLIRLPFNVVQQWQRLESADPQSLYPMFDSLNQLGEVPWVVNKPILDLQLQVFRNGGDKSLDIPIPPSRLDLKAFDKDDFKSNPFRRRLAINRAKAEMYSLWCDSVYKLSLANYYRDDVFWLPHNMDFRGRVYACPPHLSQLGADSARSLLLFARKRPLGQNGLYWLKLHAINLTGTMKKSTIQERYQYAEKIIDKILDSADNPLDGEGWWKESEDPWQTLACCKEIANAMRSPDHTKYWSGFPIHQDGSCNGLQHYAALGADKGGAEAVNLANKDKPQDVYAAIAEKVEIMRAKDAAEGVVAAQVLNNFIRRKVIKQTVMTTVYGVTKYGARLQIAKQLKDIDEFPKEHVWQCSQYLTAKTFASLTEMFTSTKMIQDWFTECAKVISSVCGSTVEWVTPLGLPVVQPYFHRQNYDFNTPVDHLKRPCTVKQRNAFPPNFIHSLDSTHMMLTSLYCQARGVNFVSVHDCFWTNVDSVDLMNKICREQFVALHSQPILDDLSKFMIEKYSYMESTDKDTASAAANKRRVNILLQKVPEKGNFKLENVLKSVYFFS